jgi:hypothetical protein
MIVDKSRASAELKFGPHRRCQRVHMGFHEKYRCNTQLQVLIGQYVGISLASYTYRLGASKLPIFVLVEPCYQIR